MKSFEYTIKDEIGIHARPAGLLAKAAKDFESEITVKKGDKAANAVKLMQLMSLGVKQGETVVVEINGSDEEAAAEAMENFFSVNL